MSTEFNLHDYMKEQTGNAGGKRGRQAGAPQSLGREYYWLTTVSAGGRFCILGPYADENLAQQAGYSELDQEFECHRLNTRDRGLASAELEKIRLSKTHNIDLALQRASHRSDAQINAQFNRSGY